MLPNLAQGGCQAIEDGAVLADALRTSSDDGRALVSTTRSGDSRRQSSPAARGGCPASHICGPARARATG